MWQPRALNRGHDGALAQISKRKLCRREDPVCFKKFEWSAEMYGYGKVGETDPNRDALDL